VRILGKDSLWLTYTTVLQSPSEAKQRGAGKGMYVCKETFEFSGLLSVGTPSPHHNIKTSTDHQCNQYKR